MTYPNNGVANLATLINTTTAQAAANVLNPNTNGTQGTPQTAVTYPLVYGTASASLINAVNPTQNSWMVVGATASPSGSNMVNGLVGYGSGQGNAQNPSIRTSVPVPASFDLLYAQIGAMLTYQYRI